MTYDVDSSYTAQQLTTELQTKIRVSLVSFDDSYELYIKAHGCTQIVTQLQYQGRIMDGNIKGYNLSDGARIDVQTV